MDINNIAEVLSELVKDDSLRSEIYSRILEGMDEWDVVEIESGIDPVLDELVENMEYEDEEEFEEDEDYENSWDAQHDE
jgi:hypothetical protein